MQGAGERSATTQWWVGRKEKRMATKKSPSKKAAKKPAKKVAKKG